MSDLLSPIQQFRNDAYGPEGHKLVGRITQAGILPDSGGLMRRKMRVLGKYAIVLLNDGSGKYQDTNGVSQSVRPGDLMVIFPELAHRYGPGPGERWGETHVVFEGPVFDLWRDCGLLDALRPVIHLEPPAHWSAELEAFVRSGRPVAAMESVLEICRFLELLSEMIAAGAAERTVRGPWLARACDLLGADLEQHLDLASVAGRLGMSYESFRKLFQKGTGMSPARFRAGRVIDAACAMMQHEPAGNKEIARRLGFSDEYHFSRRFKQIVGLSPREFRARLPRSGLGD